MLNHKLASHQTNEAEEAQPNIAYESDNQHVSCECLSPENDPKDEQCHFGHDWSFFHSCWQVQLKHVGLSPTNMHYYSTWTPLISEGN